MRINTMFFQTIWKYKSITSIKILNHHRLLIDKLNVLFKTSAKITLFLNRLMRELINLLCINISVQSESYIYIQVEYVIFNSFV